ncbi:hypothetical protein [Actinomadura oligospora]|nr:hypothetical protein [Actinomadura oligospora]
MEELINELNDLPTDAIEVRRADAETADATTATSSYCGLGGVDCHR